MHANDAWIALFRRLPAELHDALALGITTGAEIVVQKIVKLEPDFMIIRGRLAGTQDAGRLVMIPYIQLTFVAIQRDLKDAEVEAMFGKAAPIAVAAAPSPPPPVEPPSAPAEAPAPVAEPATVNQPAPAVNPAQQTAMQSKAAMVAKLRQRLKEQDK